MAATANPVAACDRFVAEDGTDLRLLNGVAGTPHHHPRFLGGPMQQFVSSCECVRDVQPDRERVVVRLAGELDFAAASAVGAAIEVRGPRNVDRVFELTGTHSMFAYEDAEVPA
jgi:hypothetical protein